METEEAGGWIIPHDWEMYWAGVAKEQQGAG